MESLISSLLILHISSILAYMLFGLFVVLSAQFNFSSAQFGNVQFVYPMKFSVIQMDVMKCPNTLEEETT